MTTRENAPPQGVLPGNGPAPSPAAPADARRRDALRRLGRGAACALPATLAMMTMDRAVALS